MNCHFCSLTDDLVYLQTERHGILAVCRKCLADLVDAELGDIQDAHCTGCQNYNGSGCRFPGVTPGTCA